jgi:hypothetical protein
MQLSWLMISKFSLMQAMVTMIMASSFDRGLYRADRYGARLARLVSFYTIRPRNGRAARLRYPCEKHCVLPTTYFSVSATRSSPARVPLSESNE